MTSFKILFTVVILFVGLRSREQSNNISLAGKWLIKIDSLGTGEKQQWYKQPSSFFEREIKLPGTLDEVGIGNPVTVLPELKKEVLLHLWRKVSYTGPAWYQKEIDIPAAWEKKHIELFLERVIWESKVWIDGNKAEQIGESLTAPHVFNLSALLTPGKHLITLRIDNSKKYDISLGQREFAHAYTNETQIIWNGVIGEIRLRAKEDISFTDLQVYPDQQQKNVRVTCHVKNYAEQDRRTNITFSISDGERSMGDYKQAITVKPGINELSYKIDLKQPVKLWDEFSPVLYSVKAEVKSGKKIDTASVTFGFRSIGNENGQLTINDRPLFLRGTLECAIFPLTGRPPMDTAEWQKIFRTVKSYGLNHLRFHSWCPPEAAFRAADEAGLYLQVELPVWSLKIGQDSAADNFLKREAERIISFYGNHPSLCFWSMGNEMQGNMQWLSDEVNALKAKDRRHLYTTTTFTFQDGYGKWPLAADDFFVTQYTKNGWVRGQGIFDAEAPAFDKDYHNAVDSLQVPLVTHEIGQYAVYPKLNEISKYTGVLNPLNFLAIKKALEKKQLLTLAGDFTKASGQLAVILYKEEIERALKTKGVHGFQLLDLQDYPGQGTALVGILDAFWESKGLITPENFRKFCSPIVPLLRFQQAVYTSDETFTADVEVANFGGLAIEDVVIKWQMLDENNFVIGTGQFAEANIAIGNTGKLGEINARLNNITKAQKLTIKINLEHTGHENEWNIWVYPPIASPKATGIVFTTNVNEAISSLDEGKTVLLNPGKENIKGVEGKFVPVFWSPVHFPDQPGTMGLLINKDHPAFKDFPTDTYTNWQWWDLCKESTTMVLDSAGISTAAIVLRNIDNFFKNRNMASIIEGKVGKGKLLFSAMDIHTDLGSRPVAQQLKFSLLNYMSSKSFNPQIQLDNEILKRLIR